MAKTKSTKRALLMSGLALFACISMLVGSTFAWFTDSVVSKNNIIAAGNLDVELLADGAEVTETTKLFDDVTLWEPGAVVYENLQIANKGTLALKYEMTVNVLSENDLNGHKLSEVVKVAVIDAVADGATRADILAAAKASATKGDLANLYLSGELLAGKSSAEQAVVVFWEPGDNDNLYNANNGQPTSDGEALHIEFGVTLVATQLTHEEDSFDNQYDAQADLFTPVSNYNELKIALANKKNNIRLTNDVLFDETLTVDYEVTISGCKMSRAAGFTGDMLSLQANSTLTLKDVTMDGGAVWAADGSNTGAVATGALVTAAGKGNLILEKGAVLKNNDGAHAVNLGTRIGATLTINGGEVVYNRSASGAVWGGGHIVMNDGKISHNSSTGLAGAIRMVSSCSLTMNGGEISNNTAAGDGGAIWGYGSSTYHFNGGKMNGNTSAGTGGAIYTGTYSVIRISGDFELCNNTAANSGAIRLTDHTSMTITGGKISGNTQNGDSNAFNTWNNSISITAGELEDNMSYVGGLTLTIGAAEIDGVIAYDLSTNHNTAYLAAEFNSFKFTVDETNANFANFNFKPAAGYTYTAGDEAKLVCQNAGYSTYWDAATGTFRLQAD